MPTVRYQIRNEYGLADPEVYRAAEKDDPEALLEGVAMAGLVGVLRQLGDLAEFAAEVFHDLHEEVMATSARGHGLILRLQQLDVEFPLIEKSILSQTDHSRSAYNAGIDWHPNLRVEQNLIIQGDMPRFILDSYEECRGPPQLFMLDKFDVAGAGACLTRYSNPSFFKTQSASSEIIESELQREKRPRRIKKGSCWRNGAMTSSFFMPIIDYSQFLASEPVPEKLPSRLVKLKHRNLRVSDISNRKSYMEGLFDELAQNDPKISLSDSKINKSIDWVSEVREILTDGLIESSIFNEEVIVQSPKEVPAKFQNPDSQNSKEEEMLIGLSIEMDIHNFDISSDEIDLIPPHLQLAERNNLLLDSGFITDVDHDSYGSDDVGSELENYVDALNTLETEVETDSESRGKSDPSFFNCQSQGINPNTNGHLDLQSQSSGSGFIASLDTLVYPRKMKDVMPNMQQSPNLVDIPYQHQLRTILEETSSLEIEINQGETGKIERAGECMEVVPSACLSLNETCYQKQLNATMLAPISRELERAGECIEIVPSACLSSNETCYQKQPNTTMLVPISRDTSSSSSISDSALKPNGDLKEAQSLCSHLVEVISGSAISIPEVNEHVESSILPLKTNHVVVPPTFKDHPDTLDEDNLLGHREDITSVTITDKDHMSCHSSKTDYIILQEKGPAECSRILPLTLMDDELGKPFLMQEPEDKSHFLSGYLLSSTPIGSNIPESHDMTIDTEVDMLSDYSAIKSTVDNLEGFDLEKLQLNSNVLIPDETHELTFLVSGDSGSDESTQTSENAFDDLASMSDERGSHHGKRKDSMIGHFSGYTQKTMSNDTANTFQITESPHKCSVVDVSTDYVKHDETYSVKNLSAESSVLSLKIVSSNLQPENLASEIRNISVAQIQSVNPQSPASSGDVDIFECDASNSAAISYEQFPVAEEPQESATLDILEPLLSTSGEDSYATHLELEGIELTEFNVKDHVDDELEFTNGSTKLDELLVGESKDNKSLDGNSSSDDGIDGQVLHLLESTKLSTFDLLLKEDPLPEIDALYQLKPDDEPPVITRESKFSLSENKPYFTLIQNEEQDMFMDSLSSQTSVLDLSNSFDTNLVDTNVDDPHVKLYLSLKGADIVSRENKQDSDSISENAISEDDTNGKVLPTLQSSNLCSSDVLFHEDPVSEDATLNQNMPEIENLDNASHDSTTKNGIAEDGSDHQVLSQQESSYAYSFDARTEEVLFSEVTSLNHHRMEIEEPTITSDLTSLNFEREVFVPFSKNGIQEKPGSVVSSSQSLPLYSSNIANAMLPDHNFTDVLLESYPCLYEESLTCFRVDEQDSYSDVSVQHFTAGAERPKPQFEQASEYEPSTIPLHQKKENIELPDIGLDEDCSDEHTIIQHSLEHEVLTTEQEPNVFLNHGSSNELSIPAAGADVREQIDTDRSIPFQDVSEHPGISMAPEDFATKSLVADFISPFSITSMEEPPRALPGETISRLSLLEGTKETPPLPPLPPIQWRTGKPPPGFLVSDACVAQPVAETNSLMFPSNTHMDQQTDPFMSHTASCQHVSPCTDAQMTEFSNLSEFPQIKFDQRRQFEIQIPEIETAHLSGLTLIESAKEDGNHAHGNIAMERGDQFTLEERRPKLVKLLPGLELERSQEASIVEADVSPPFNSFLFMPTTGDGMYQYDYGDYGGYEGENLQHHSLSGSFPVAVHGFPHYGYHMFLREGNSSTMYDIKLPEMEGDNQNGKHRSIRIRQRDPLIEAVAAHDKSTLRKVSELDRPLTKSNEDETNILLEQIKHKSFNLKPATSAKANILKAPSTNLKVAAILQKANAIRQACVGSDEDDDDNWS